MKLKLWLPRLKHDLARQLYVPLIHLSAPCCRPSQPLHMSVVPLPHCYLPLQLHLVSAAVAAVAAEKRVSRQLIAKDYQSLHKLCCSVLRDLVRARSAIHSSKLLFRSQHLDHLRCLGEAHSHRDHRSPVLGSLGLCTTNVRGRGDIRDSRGRG